MSFVVEINDWAGGVVKSIEADKLPPNALSSALNTQFLRVGGGQSAIGTRPGFRLATVLGYTGGAAILRARLLQPYQYAVTDSSVHTNYLAVLDSNGRVALKEPDDSWDGTFLSSGAAVVPAADASSTCMTVMNNRLLIAGGASRASYLGKTAKQFGVPQPVCAYVVTTAYRGLGGLPIDTYDVWATTYNPTLGSESSPQFVGEIAITAANQAIQVQPTFSPAEGYRVYMRRQSTQSVAYLVTNLYLNGTLYTSDGFMTIAAADIESTAAEIADYVIQMPSVNENDPMPDGVISMCAFGRRLLAVTRRKLFWSKLDKPDAFPPENFENIDTGEGDELVALMPTNDERCLVLTKTSVWMINGDDPQTWSLSALDTTIGCVGAKSVIKFDNSVAWWSGQYGPVVFDGQSIQKIGLEMIGAESLETIPAFQWELIAGGWDPQYQHIVWTVPNTTETIADEPWGTAVLLPFNYRLGRWVAESWDPIGVTALGTGFDNHGRQRLFATDSAARLMYADNTALYDGWAAEPVGTVTGTFVAVGDSVSSITSTGFQQTGSSPYLTLKFMRLTIVDSAGNLVARRTITSQTSTTAIGFNAVDVVNDNVYTYYIGVPYVQVSTPWLDAQQPFIRKRFDRVYTDIVCSDPTVSTRIDVQLNNNGFVNERTISVLAAQYSSATTNATWDTTVLTSVPFAKLRNGIWLTGHTARIQLTQYRPVRVVFSKLAVIGRLLSDRYYL